MSETIQELTEEQKLKKKIDFKIITFSLGGKEYAIDIMKIKEILKESKFTMVPNTAPFVRGVHNLRGEIIPIIDLRKMFHVSVLESKKKEEDVLILKLEDITLGVIVDQIDRVVGIAKEEIKPPHPLFSDINVKYISGVVESEGKLYIILDVDRIFGKEEVLASTYGETEDKEEHKVVEKEIAVKADEKDIEFKFVAETLVTFKSFYITELNYDWAKKRFSEWKSLRSSSGLKVQLENINDAEEFLKPFYSPYTGMLWGSDYKENFQKILPNSYPGMINVWNLGCGKGYESYSIAAILRDKYESNLIKIWANDNDLLNISTAPNLVLSREQIPSYFFDRDFVEEASNNGYRFKRELKDLITFEYHDILNRNDYPKLDIIVARDILSFQKPDKQEWLLDQFKTMLNDNGIVILGVNESIQEKGWYRLEEGNLVAYKLERI